METLAEVKRVVYQGFTDDKMEMVYAIDEDAGGLWCVYSGVTRHVTSTINTLESVINQLMDEEGVRPDECSFYDLQTHLQYESVLTGMFKFNRVLFKKRGEDEFALTGWDIWPCPPVVYEFFLPYIGQPIPDREREYFSTDSNPEWQRQRGIAELASGQFRIYNVPEALRGGYEMRAIFDYSPSRVQAQVADVDRRHPGHEYIIVDVGDYPSLLVQVEGLRQNGARFWAWSRRCGKKSLPYSSGEIIIGGSSV